MCVFGVLVNDLGVLILRCLLLCLSLLAAVLLLPVLAAACLLLRRVVPTPLQGVRDTGFCTGNRSGGDVYSPTFGLWGSR